MTQFLKREVRFLGIIPDDSTIMNAVIDQKPFLMYKPNCQASKAIINISYEFLQRQSSDEIVEQPVPFISKLKDFFLKGR
jgi:flagellar biosynthesis protein FlhG